MEPSIFERCISIIFSALRSEYMKISSRWIGLIVLACLPFGCTPAVPVPPPSPTFVPTLVSAPASTATLEVTVAKSLQLGLWHDMVYYEATEQVILINGGPENGKSPDDPVELWTWDGNDWSLVDTDLEGPRWRNFASVAYDSNRDVLVLYGGVRSDGEFQDMWEWDGKGWTQISERGPGPREAAGMAYDAGRGKIVLFGGSQSGQMMNDTWEWDGAQWIPIPVGGPSARFPAAFVYDVSSQNILLFGGHKYDSEGFTTHADTWTWDGVTWTLLNIEGPSARDGAKAIFDRLQQKVLLFGGAEITTSVRNLNDTWLWDGTRWERLEVEGPPARVHPALAFDLKRGVTIMTGGSNGPGSILQDTWEWNGVKWVCTDGCE